MTDGPNASKNHIPVSLERFLWLSFAAAVITLLIKIVAAWMTNSMGLWSDALESTVNVVAAVIALWAMRLAVKPADDNHDFGHGKAEYISAALEGGMIFIAAVGILYGGVLRLISPEPLEQLGWGMALSTGAAVINLVVGLVLLRVGKRHNSITLEADGQHLLTDVVTSIGVLIGIALVIWTGWTVLDPIVAIAVGINIIFTGYRLIKRSGVGLLDGALPQEEVELVSETLSKVVGDRRIEIAELRTRESGRQRFVYATLCVPGTWTVSYGHDIADEVEDAISAVLPGTLTFVHIEPNDGETSTNEESSTNDGAAFH